MKDDLHVFELVTVGTLTAVFASDPLPGPRIDGLVAGDSSRIAVVLNQDVETFSVGRFTRLLETFPRLKFVLLQLATGLIEKRDHLEAVVRTLVAAAETLGCGQAGSTGKGQSDNIRGLHRGDWGINGKSEGDRFCRWR